MNIQALREQIILHEGMMLKPYKDSVGKITIGVGRNLDDVGINQREAMMMLDNDIQVAFDELDKAFRWWRSMSENRQNVIADMCFNMGIVRLLGFKNALVGMQSGNYETAAIEMENSAWYRQVGSRGVSLVAQMRQG